jgi:hypothetical protein
MISENNKFVQLIFDEKQIIVRCGWPKLNIIAANEKKNE